MQTDCASVAPGCF